MAFGPYRLGGYGRFQVVVVSGGGPTAPPGPPFPVTSDEGGGVMGRVMTDDGEHVTYDPDDVE